MSDNPEVSVVPTQADRELAEFITSQTRGYGVKLPKDADTRVQAAARHRLAHQTPPATHGGSWRVNPDTPSVIITPHGRISINWLVQHEGDSNDFSLAEETAAMIVAAVNSRAAPPASKADPYAHADGSRECRPVSPATQPTATAGEVERIRELYATHEAFPSGKTPRNGGTEEEWAPYWAANRARRELLAAIPKLLATLPTPLPVAQVQHDDTQCGCVGSFGPNPDCGRCGGAGTFTPPPDATATVVEAGCTVPPAGWRCTRTAGHSGPCAAVPTDAPPTVEEAWRAGFGAAEEVLGAHGSEWLLGALENAWAEYEADHALAATPTPPAGGQ